MKKPVPTQTESPFNFNEFFFSVTDKRGVIRFGNDVFVWVSAYAKETMIGAPHSIIRHPDMPRAVFKEFWDILHQEKPVGAYVKNLAGNGSYYWVFAFVFPVKDGYLSIRFKPSSALFAAVQVIYQEVLQKENQGADLEDSHAFLLEKIREAGFPDYEHFMVKAVIDELKARSEQDHLLPQSQNVGHLSSEQSQITDVTNSTTGKITALFERVREFQEANQVFSDTIKSLDEGFQNLKFISINMKIAAAKFGSSALSLGVVSNEFSILSGTIEKHLSGLSAFIKTLSEIIQQCMLRIAALNVQMLMVDFFVKESIAKLQTSDRAFSEMIENQEHFSLLFSTYSQNLEREIEILREKLSGIRLQMNEVGKFVTGLEVIRQIGAVESARTNEIKGVFGHYLAAMDEFIQLLRGGTTTINSGVALLYENSEAIISVAQTLSGSVDTILKLASSSEGGSPEKAG